MAHEIDDVVAERYRIDGLLGRGGMGEVFRAHDLRLHRAVALKVLPPDRAADPDAHARIVREARAAAVSNHAGIVHVYDVGHTDDGAAYIAMELVEGRLLREASRGAPIGQVVRWVAEVARALAAAHDAGLVHRDVKPDNVIVRDDGQPVVLDFGIARHRPVDGETAMRLTADGQILGTPAYMAPEQARGRELDARVDQFALAVTLFELLTGDLPWDARDPIAVLAAVISEEPRRLRDARPDLPEALSDAISVAMSKSAADRFGDCRAFAAALETSVEGAVGATAVAASWSLPPASGLEETLPASDPAAGPAVDVSRSRDRARGRRGPLWLGGAVALGLGAAALSLVDRGGSVEPSAPPPAPASLSLDRGAVGCVPLRVDGLEAPSGWYGAAAATRACVVVELLLGGAPERALFPADLLDLARRPDVHADDDPFCAPDARARALAAAAQRADAYLDGRVRWNPDHVTIELAVHAPDGAVAAAAEAREPSMHQAVRAALDRLVEAGALPRAERMRDSAALRTGLGRVDGAIEWLDVWDAHERGEDTSDRRCERWRAVPGAAAWLARLEGDLCAGRPVPLLEDTPFSIARSLLRGHRASPERNRELARRLSAARRDAPPAEAAVLAAGEARAWYNATDEPEALGAAYAAILAEPHGDPSHHALFEVARASESEPAVRLVTTRWRPDRQAWSYYAAYHDDPERALVFMRRSYVLYPSSTSGASDVLVLLLHTGRVEEARAVAEPFLRRSGGAGVAGRVFETLVQMSSGRVAGARASARALLEELEVAGDNVQQDPLLLGVIGELDTLQPAAEPLADLFAERFVLADPMRLTALSWSLRYACMACATATRALRSRCLERLEAQLAAGALGAPNEDSRALLAGLLAAERGQPEEAARLLRPLVDRTSVFEVDPMALVLATTLDRLSEPELADAADAHCMRHGGWIRGASTATVRSARRAHARGDSERARTLASTVVQAWQSADAHIAVLDEMREITR